jgi:hypothetical protein
MWLFTRDSFVSIVRHATESEKLLVRARVAGDIESLWPSATVVADPEADYLFRAVVPEDIVADRLARAVREITYTTNFKGGVNADRHHAYLEVWAAMLKLQRALPRSRGSSRRA